MESGGHHLHTSSHQAENDDLGDSDKPERLAEIMRILHLGNETWQRDLSDERVADVEESIHTRNERGSHCWEEEHDWIAAHLHSALVDMIGVGVVACWVVFDTSKRRRKNDTDEREEGRESGQLGERVERPWKRAEEGNERTNGREADRADGMTTHGVEKARYNTERRQHGFT